MSSFNLFPSGMTPIESVQYFHEHTPPMSYRESHRVGKKYPSHEKEVCSVGTRMLSHLFVVSCARYAEHAFSPSSTLSLFCIVHGRGGEGRYLLCAQQQCPFVISYDPLMFYNRVACRKS